MSAKQRVFITQAVVDAICEDIEELKLTTKQALHKHGYSEWSFYRQITDEQKAQLKIAQLAKSVYGKHLY